MIFPCRWVYLRNLNSLKKLKQKTGPELFLCKMGDDDDDSALVYMHWNLIRKICMWWILQLSLIRLLRHILSTVLYLITQKFFLRLIQRLWVYDSVSQMLPWKKLCCPAGDITWKAIESPCRKRGVLRLAFLPSSSRGPACKWNCGKSLIAAQAPTEYHQLTLRHEKNQVVEECPNFWPTK